METIRSNSKSKDIFYIATASYTQEGNGPSNRFVSMQCKGLLKEGFAVHVIAAYSESSNSYNYDKTFNITQFSQIHDMGIIPQSIKRIVSYLMWTMFMLKTAILSRRMTWIFNGPALSFSIVIPILRLLGIKTCYVDVDLFWAIHNPIEGSYKKLIKKIVSKVALFVIARSANHILLGGTGMLVSYFKNIAPNAHISQAWPPTDIELFSSGNRSKGRKKYNIDEGINLIVYGGSVCAREGIHILLKAFSTVVLTDPSSHLFIAGKIPPEGYLPWLEYGVIDFIDMVDKLGITNNTTFSGMLEKEDLIDMFNAADILVMPKVDHPFNAAAMPIKVGEYLATANPLVSSNICDIDKYFEDGKNILLVEPNNSKSLSEKILWVYNNKKVSKIIGKEGFKKAVEMFDYSCWTNTLLKLIGDKKSLLKDV